MLAYLYILSIFYGSFNERIMGDHMIYSPGISRGSWLESLFDGSFAGYSIIPELGIHLPLVQGHRR
jgi:hypothetical protein